MSPSASQGQDHGVLLWNWGPPRPSAPISPWLRQPTTGTESGASAKMRSSSSKAGPSIIERDAVEDHRAGQRPLHPVAGARGGVAGGRQQPRPIALHHLDQRAVGDLGEAAQAALGIEDHGIADHVLAVGAGNSQRVGDGEGGKGSAVTSSPRARAVRW